MLYNLVNSFFCHVGMFSRVEPELSSKDKVPCPRTQHSASSEA